MSPLIGWYFLRLHTKRENTVQKNISQKDPELIRRIYQLPVGLLAQLVERCTGIAEVMGSNPVRA